MLEIVDIDMRLDHQSFSNIMDDVIHDESNRTGISFDWSDKESHLNRSNLNVYKVTVTNMDSSNTIDLVAEHSGNDIVFKPFELRNFNESFYKQSYEDDDLTQVMILALKRIALKASGNFGCIFDGQYTLIQKGRDISAHVKGMALIDDKGKVYNIKNKQSLDEQDDDEDVMGYIPKYLINDWLEENIAFQAKLQSVPKQDQFEIMGQFATYQKRKGMITADQFRDILLQIGTFADMIGGFKGETLKSIYQFFI